MARKRLIGFSGGCWRPTAPIVRRVYPRWSTVLVCRLASGSDSDSELIEVVW